MKEGLLEKLTANELLMEGIIRVLKSFLGDQVNFAATLLSQRVSGGCHRNLNRIIL